MAMFREASFYDANMALLNAIPARKRAPLDEMVARIPVPLLSKFGAKARATIPILKKALAEFIQAHPEVNLSAEPVEEKDMSPADVSPADVSPADVSPADVSLPGSHPADVPYQITNSDALREKIHEIHNYMRNAGAGYGMNALKVFNILYGLKKIEDAGLNESVGLKDCKFSHLLELATAGRDDELAAFMLTKMIDMILESDIHSLLFYEIPKNIKCTSVSYLVKEISRIGSIEESSQVQLSGKIYEYFIGRDESAISELGAYFTNRRIVNFILDRLQPSIADDGSVGTMVDMFGGSGGFTTGYVSYLATKYGRAINWKNELNKVFHFDANDDVVKSAGLELFCLTGTIPAPRTNLDYRNSFTDDFINPTTGERMRFKYVLTNPPYGGDKTEKSDSQKKRDKVKASLKKDLLNKDILPADKVAWEAQLKKIRAQEVVEKIASDKTKVSVAQSSRRIQDFAKKHGLDGNDKESCSLMLLMDMVEEGGTGIGVLKEGVFFDNTYAKLRKCLIENYNVREVISVPADQFENTKTKTSILIFDNTGKTERIRFSKMIVDTVEEDKFGTAPGTGERVLLENKGDIIGVRDELVSTATMAELLKGKAAKAPLCSLNGKDYNISFCVPGEGYEMVKLGDICEFMPKSQRQASFGSSVGQFNFYTSSDKVKRCDVADYKDECLIIGNGGVANIKLDANFSCSDHNYVIRSTNLKYLYYLITGNMNFLSDGFAGSTLQNISKEYVKGIMIPIPKSPERIAYWVERISRPYNEKIEKQKRVAELEEHVQSRIKHICDTEECEEVALSDLCHFVDGKKRNMGHACVGGMYPLFSSSLLVDNWIDTYDYDKACVIVNTVNGSGRFNLQHATRFCATADTIIFSTGDACLTVYTYYYGMINIEDITKLANDGSIRKRMQKSSISKFRIKLPKNRQLVADMEQMFQEIQTLKAETIEAEICYKKYISELRAEAISN